MPLFSKDDVAALARVQNLFQACADGIRAHGAEGLDEKFSDIVDDKYRFIVESHARALSDFHTRIKAALTASPQFTGADVTLMISARYWVSEIFDLCCQCPTSKIAEYMVQKGCVSLHDTKNGWEEYTSILRSWLKILYQEE